MDIRPIRIERTPAPAKPETANPIARPAIADHGRYVSITLEFRCNLRCEHCMIEGTMDWLEPRSTAEFDELLDYNRSHAKWSGLILTGSEITLRKDLPELVARARQAGFRDVRIQTHGMALARPDYCERLVEAGVNEFFVSVPGCDAATHDAITQVPGSFERTMRGLRNLEAFEHVTSVTNSVVTARNYRILPEIVAALRPLRRLKQMEFWFFWPMRESDDKDLIVSHREALPWLRRAIEAARADGRAVELKNVPQCLLGEDSALLVNDQPLLVIDPRFWDEFERNGFHRCVHREHCKSEQCLGLNAAYTAKFGWEADILRPLDASGRPLQPG